MNYILLIRHVLPFLYEYITSNFKYEISKLIKNDLQIHVQYCTFFVEVEFNFSFSKLERKNSENLKKIGHKNK